MQKRALVGTIFILIALFMITLSLVMPWYQWEMTVEGYGEPDSYYVDYHLDHAESTGLGVTVDVDYDEEPQKDFNYIQTLKTTQIIAYIGIIGCIIGLIGTVIVTMDKLSSRGGAVLVLLAVIFSLMAPLYLMIALPAAFEEDARELNSPLPSEKIETDFFGSDKYEEESLGSTVTYEITWGGSIGWFLTIFAAIIVIIAFILIIISKPAPAPISQEMPMPFDMYAQPNAMFQPQEQAQFYYEQTSAYTQAPFAEPFAEPQGEEFQCPQCNRIFILTTAKRPAILRCPYCGLEGLVE